MLGLPEEAKLAVVAVFDALEALQIPYHVGGSFASSIHGIPRATRDLDIVVDLRLHQIPKFVASMTDFYLDASSIEDAVRRKSSFNLLHPTSGLKIDFFIQGDGVFDRIERMRPVRRTLLTAPDRKVPIASAEDTILRKLEWYRLGGDIAHQQWLDVLGILSVGGQSLDHDYLHRWAGSLGIEALLRRALAEVPDHRQTNDDLD